MKYGWREGRDPHPLFDVQFYLQNNQDVAEAQAEPLGHYCSHGWREGRDPHPRFNTSWYLQKNVDVAVAGVNPLGHYVRYGREERRSPGRAESGNISSLATYSASTVKTYPGLVKQTAGLINVLLVGHAATDHLFGGERSFLDMLDALKHLPANVYIALPRNVPDYTNFIRRQAAQVVIFPYGWWNEETPSSDETRQHFKDIITEYKIDVLHANTIMLRECLEAARECGIQSIIHARELISKDKELLSKIGATAETTIEKVKERADWIIGNSKATCALFNKQGRTLLVSNTIDVAGFDASNPVQAGKIRFGLISSNTAKKGVRDLCEVAELAKDSCPNAEFCLIGPDTEMVENLKEQQHRGELPKNIVFSGYAISPKDAVTSVNVVLNLSHFAESFGRTVLEGLAARRPVIGYDYGAISELIEHGKTGFLAKYREPKDVLKYVKVLCDSPDLIAEFGERGRSFAHSLDITNYRTSFKRAYEIIAKSKHEVVRTVLAEQIKSRPTRDATLRLAYFCWWFPSPSETFVLNELRELVASGVDIIVFCRDSPFPDFVPDFPITVERTPTAAALAERLKETRRTMVHAHFVYPTVTDIVWPACEEAKVPFTFIAHAQDIFRHESNSKNKLADIGASPWCRKLFTLSQYHFDYIVERGFPARKLAINPNAVDVERFSKGFVAGREERRFRKIVAIHRYVPKKGLSLLIRAAALIRDLDVKIELYGSGEEEREYRAIVAELALTNVSIKGPLSQDEVVDVLRRCDLAACPSVRLPNGDMDGIPTSIVESMIAGVPVLTTNLSGISELVIDGLTGLIAEPTPESIAAAIERFYAMPSTKLQAMIEDARDRASRRHDVKRLVRVLMRTWLDETVDIVLVSWNNCSELRMVVDRIIKHTALPYRLIICDNKSSDKEVHDFLKELLLTEECVSVIYNDVNAMVGPGTNKAIEAGASDFIIYVCSKEGIVFRNGWDTEFLHTLVDNPEAGLAGTVARSPSYLVGAQYPNGIDLFGQFRNQNFAYENPDRAFGHIQGGMFGMRRSMYDEIGGFSNEVPHSYTDVEYSFYAESRGWKLVNVPGIISSFVKSRPTLSQRFDESIIAAHPVVSPAQLKLFDRVVAGGLRHCNVCDWFGDAFLSRDSSCPSCLSTSKDRSLFRWLAESDCMHRRLPALAVGLSGFMDAIWKEQFQGPVLDYTEFGARLVGGGRLQNGTRSLSLAIIRADQFDARVGKLITHELGRLLRPGGIALFQAAGSKQLSLDTHAAAFDAAKSIRYSSSALDFDFVPMQSFIKK